jgi:hypothetical protein
MTSIDYFPTNSCGLTKFSDILEGNYRAVKDNFGVNCPDPWYKDYSRSSFGSSGVDCCFYRDFTWLGAHLIAID